MINTSAARVHRGKVVLPRPASSMIALTLFLATIELVAQSPQPSPQTTAPTLHVYSRETIVDVTVTDAKGNPVHGLTRDDFTIKEDNKPQPIRAAFTSTTASPSPHRPNSHPTSTPTSSHHPPAAPSMSSCSTSSTPRQTSTTAY